MRAAILIFALTLTAQAQWTLQQSPTTADLRGIDNVGNGIAWASGANGTILRPLVSWPGEHQVPRNSSLGPRLPATYGTPRLQPRVS